MGFLEIGLPLDAHDELEGIAPEYRHLPDVLAVRAQIYRRLEKWELLQVIAGQLAKVEPNKREWPLLLATATRWKNGLAGARVILLAALKVHLTCAPMRYNLACYECQLGDLEAAGVRLWEAFTLAAALRLSALDDEDLSPLWESLRSAAR